MTKTYRELLWGLHKAGNVVPDFNTAPYALSGYRILHNVMSLIYILHDSLLGLSMTSHFRPEDAVRQIGTGVVNLRYLSRKERIGFGYIQFHQSANFDIERVTVRGGLHRSDARYIEIAECDINIGVFLRLLYREGDGHQSNIISSGDWNILMERQALAKRIRKKGESWF